MIVELCWWLISSRSLPVHRRWLTEPRSSIRPSTIQKAFITSLTTLFSSKMAAQSHQYTVTTNVWVVAHITRSLTWSFITQMGFMSWLRLHLSPRPHGWCQCMGCLKISWTGSPLRHQGMAHESSLTWSLLTSVRLQSLTYTIVLHGNGSCILVNTAASDTGVATTTSLTLDYTSQMCEEVCESGKAPPPMTPQWLIEAHSHLHSPRKWLLRSRSHGSYQYMRGLENLVNTIISQVRLKELHLLHWYSYTFSSLSSNLLVIHYTFVIYILLTKVQSYDHSDESSPLKWVLWPHSEGFNLDVNGPHTLQQYSSRTRGSYHLSHISSSSYLRGLYVSCSIWNCCMNQEFL